LKVHGAWKLTFADQFLVIICPAWLESALGDSLPRLYELDSADHASGVVPGAVDSCSRELSYLKNYKSPVKQFFLIDYPNYI
jgi:hypothetical protein